MRKAMIIAIFILAALLLANTALGRYVSQSDDIAVAGSGAIDVKIVERSKCDGLFSEYTSEKIDAVSSVDETLRNLAPGESVTLSYKIVNNGCVDVLLNGVDICVNSNEFYDCLTLNWTITQYEDNIPVKSTSEKIRGTSLCDGHGLAEVSFAQIVLDCDCKTDDYCLLQVDISFDETDSSHINIAHEAVFTITPLFIQN